MNAQRRRGQQQSWRSSGETSAPSKYPCRSKAESAARRRPPPAGPHSARARESSSPAPAAADAGPRPPSASITASRPFMSSVSRSSMPRSPLESAGTCEYIKSPRSPGSSPAIPARSSRLQPPLRLHAKQGIGMRAIRRRLSKSRANSCRQSSSVSSSAASHSPPRQS